MFRRLCALDKIGFTWWRGLPSQFGSLQFKMVSMRSEKPVYIIMRSTPSLRIFPSVNAVPVFVWLHSHLSSTIRLIEDLMRAK